MELPLIERLHVKDSDGCEGDCVLLEQTDRPHGCES